MEARKNNPHHKISDRRVEMSTAGLQDDFAWHLRYTLAKDRYTSTDRDLYQSLALSVRDRMIERWIATQNTYHSQNVKRVYYLSLEFLIGRLLGTNVLNLQMEQYCREAMETIGLDWNKLRDYEEDAGLGNGGLGRLAACFLDSMSTLGLPAIGYGLRYDYGIFKQLIVDGAQVEQPDRWQRNGYPWEIERPEYSCTVNFEGRTELITENGESSWHWVDTKQVLGVPFDLPIVGYGGKVVNTLRLWSAQATDEFDLADFNRGSYVEAVEDKVLAENLTKVLYPNDNVLQGKELRLRQQYFFVACSLHDILRRFKAHNSDWSDLPKKAFIQLNETHPALAIPELMRLLVDHEKLDWEVAWQITRQSFGYTNHTILPEALEHWSVPMMEHLLPRHMQIIYEINQRFLKRVAAAWPGDDERLARMSVISENGHKEIRMANLAIIGSSSVNGVAKLHSEILKERLFRDFYEFSPGQFSNKTNGITQRRWLLKANPGLSKLITSAVGDGWITDLDILRGLERFADDTAFLNKFRTIKQANKQTLADYIESTMGITLDVTSIFDVQIKRLHEYKRQLLLVLYIIVLFNRLVENPALSIHPRTFIFAAKAAPGYVMAKLIIRFVHAVADVVNAHPGVNKLLRVVFIPDYRVSLAEKIIPAANLSEQISLAGTEASGTGNMKLMLNGAITIGTMDGANVEIYEEVGAENIFIFGMNADEVGMKRKAYDPRVICAENPEIARVVEMIRSDYFCYDAPGTFAEIGKALIDYGDYYMLLADLNSYIETQAKVEALYNQPLQWDRKALLNVARSGKFSSDRTIQEYAREIWGVTPCEGTPIAH